MPEPNAYIRMNAARWLAILALCLVPNPAWAEPGLPSPVSAEARVSKRQATVGDLLKYSIVVRHDKGIHLAPPDPSEHFRKGFELVDRGVSETEAANGQIEETFWFQLRADQVGFYTVPAIPIAFTAPSPDDPARAIPGTLQAPEVVIEIRSVLFLDPQEPSDIKDIKPIIGAGLDWRKYLKWVYIGLAILCALGLFFWWVGKRKHAAQAQAAAPPVLKPYEIALAELDRLAERKLIEAGRFQEHYFELSEILRRYLGTLLSIPALDWTTEEIAAHVSGHQATPAELRQTILTLLPVTDQIKFARAPVDPETASRHVAAVRDLVQRSIPETHSKYQIKSETAA